jgi:hypothetical protein
MFRFGVIVVLSLISTVGFSQKFFSWPIYENAGVGLNKNCSDTIYLRDNRPILKYSKYNCSAQEIASDIAISLLNNGISKFCVIPYSAGELSPMNCFVLELGFYYSYLNFNIWDSRVDFQLVQYNSFATKKFDFISRVNSERNNWGHKSGQKALKNSFEAAMLVLVSQMQEKY